MRLWILGVIAATWLLALAYYGESSGIECNDSCSVGPGACRDRGRRAAGRVRRRVDRRDLRQRFEASESLERLDRIAHTDAPGLENLGEHAEVDRVAVADAAVVLDRPKRVEVAPAGIGVVRRRRAAARSARPRGGARRRSAPARRSTRPPRAASCPRARRASGSVERRNRRSVPACRPSSSTDASPRIVTGLES